MNKYVIFCLLLLCQSAAFAQPQWIERNVARSKATLALAVAEPGWKDGEQVNLQGYASAGDGGGQPMIYRRTGWSSLTATQQAQTAFYARIGATDAYLEAIDKSQHNVLVYGADATGVADSSIAFQAAIDAAIADGSRQIFIPLAAGQRYRLASKVNIASQGFTIRGDATGSPLSGYVFTDQDISALIDYGNGQSVSTGQFNVFDVVFWQSSNTTSLADTAVLVSPNNNGPHRGMRFQNVTGYRFPNLVTFDAPSASFAAANVYFDNCNNIAGTNLVNAVDEVLGLVVDGSQTEQGSRITGKLSSHTQITNNMLEGQSNPITIVGGLGSVEVSGNYFEANNGDYLLDVNYTNADTSIVKWGPNFNSGTQPTDICKVGFVNFVNASGQPSEQILTVKDGGVLLGLSQLQGGGYKVENVANGSDHGSILNPIDYLRRGQKWDWQEDAASWTPTGVDLLPHGEVGPVRNITSGYQQIAPTISYSAGDLIYASFLIKFADAGDPGSSSGGILLYNSSFSQSTGSSYFWYTKDGNERWLLCTTSWVAPFSDTSARIRFYPYGISGSGDGCEFAGAAVKVVATPGTRPVVHPFYPIDLGEKYLSEFSSDRANPPEGSSVIWQSDGTGAGDDGDVLLKVTAASTTTTHYLTERAPLGYAQISIEDNATATTVASTQSDWSAKSQYTLFGSNFASSSNATPDHTNDHITLTSAGTWEVSCVVTLSGSVVADLWELALWKNNGATQVSTKQGVNIRGAGLTYEKQMTISGLVDASANDTIELWVQRTNGTGTLTITNAVMSAKKVSD